MGPTANLRRLHRLQWLFFGLFALLVISVQGWQLWAAHERTTREQESRLRSQAQLLGAMLERQLGAIDGGLRSVAGDIPDLSDPRDARNMHARLQALDSAIAGTRTIAIVGESGRVLAASRDGLLGLDVSELPYFKDARRGNSASVLYVSPPYRTRLGVWSLNLTRVLQRGDGAFAGAVIATLDPNWLSVVVGAVNYADDMWTGLAHTDGGLLFLAPARGTGQEAVNLAQPGSMFSQHMASGQLETMHRGAVMVTGQASRLMVQRTLQPAGLQLDGNLVVGTSRSLTAVYADWREHLVASMWLNALLVVLTISSLLVIQRSERYAASMSAQIDRLAKVAERTSNAVVVADLDRRIVWINAGFTRMCGYTLDEVRGQVPGHFLQSEKTDGATMSMMRHELAAGNSFRAELCNRAKDGRDYWVNIDVQPLHGEAGRIAGYISVEVDVTEARAHRIQLERLTTEQAMMLESDLVGIVRVRNRVVMWSNHGLSRMFGYSHEALQGSKARMLYPDDESFAALGAAAYPVLRQKGIYRTQIQMRHSSGELLWIDLSGRLVSTEPEESMWMMVDITAMKERQVEMEEAAFHDALTGLPNRALLGDRLSQALEQARRQGQQVALAYMDLDGFKSINDTHGHDAGDLLLRAVAGRLLATMRSSDTVARLGGDEFVLLLSPAGTQAEVDEVIRRVHAAVAMPVELSSGSMVQVGASIGLAWYPEDGSDASALLSLADERMFVAKRTQRAARGQLHSGTPTEQA